jgi:LPS export ABC transporter protein LptC
MKRNLLQALLGLALLGVVVQVILVAPRVVRDSDEKVPQPQPSTAAANESVDQSLQGMHTIETQQGGKEWELWSDKADRIKEKDLLRLQGVKILFFARSGVTFTVTGERGTVESKTKNLRVEGNVITRSSNGYTFRSQSLDYDSLKKTLSTASAVDMVGPADKKGPGLKLDGLGMESNLEPGTMEILANVRAEKIFNGSRHVYIRSPRAMFSSTDRSARFSGGAVLDMDTMRITGPDARLNYDAKSDEVKSLTVIGGAKVSETDKWATADNLNVDFASNKFTFWGQPRVVQNNDELKGEEIVFLDGGKQVEVHRARAKMDERKMGKTP